MLCELYTKTLLSFKVVGLSLLCIDDFRKIFLLNGRKAETYAQFPQTPYRLRSSTRRAAASNLMHAISLPLL